MSRLNKNFDSNYTKSPDPDFNELMNECIDFVNSNMIKLSEDEIERIVKYLTSELGMFKFNVTPEFIVDKFETEKEYIDQFKNAVSSKLALEHTRKQLAIDYQDALNPDTKFNSFSQGLFWGMYNFNYTNASENRKRTFPPIEDWKEYIKKQTFYDRIAGKSSSLMAYIFSCFNLELKPIIELGIDELLDPAQLYAYVDDLLEAINIGWVEAVVYGGEFNIPLDQIENGNLERGLSSLHKLEISNPVFMALVNEYFLEGQTPKFKKIEMTRPQKAALIYFLRDKKTTARSINSNHLGTNYRLLKGDQKSVYDKIVKEILTTTLGNIDRLK